MNQTSLHLWTGGVQLHQGTRSIALRLIGALSVPAMVLIRLLACAWMCLTPSKREQLCEARARVSAPCPWYVALWVFALTVLQRWPMFVTVLLAIGALLALLIAGPSAILVGLTAAVVGASLAPVFARDLPAWLFPRI